MKGDTTNATELFELNLESNIFMPILKNEECAVTRVTK